MKMICDVPDEVIKSIKDGTWCGSYVTEKMIANGMPLSSSEKQNKWIPVGERLPKEEKRVLLSLTEDACEDDERVNIGCRVLKPWVEQGDEYIWVVEGFSIDFDDDEVEAWMPMPKPYKA